MFWFDKENQDVIFADNREINTTLCDGRKLLIKPDVKMDFRDMPYKDNTFKIVVFDPPTSYSCRNRFVVGQEVRDSSE